MKRRRVIVGIAACAVASIGPQRAGAKTFDGARAISGHRFEANGEAFRLLDIRAPSPHGLYGKPERGHDFARRVLAGWLSRGDLQWRDGAPVDRWGARRGVLVAGERDVAEALLAAGAALVAPYSDRLDRLREWLTWERGARDKRRGLWGEGAFRLIDADKADAAIGAFAIVRGRVVGAAKVKGRIYLNFGEDYRTDFTASVSSGRARRWANADHVDLLALEGANVRIRGFVTWRGGPAVELEHLRQVEIEPSRSRGA